MRSILEEMVDVAHQRRKMARAAGECEDTVLELYQAELAARLELARYASSVRPVSEGADNAR